MSTKKVAFGRPTPKNADDWVTAPRGHDIVEVPRPTEPAEPMKRLTIDVPKTLHSRIKAACAIRGTKMADEIRLLLEREFLEAPTQ